MNDEFIMFNDDNVDDNNSYQESYEPDDDITLEDVESYLESMRNDITDAMELRDNMIQEEYEYEDLSLEDVESYIESTIDNYNSGVDLYNTMIQESDDNLTDNFEEGVINKIKAKNAVKKSGDIERRISNIKNTTSIDDLVDLGEKVESERRAAGIPEEDITETRKRIKLGGKKNKDKSIKESYSLTDYRDSEIDLELDEPLTAYEFFDESYEPDDTPIVPRSNESIEYTQEVTLAELGLVTVVTAAAIALIKTGKALINRLKTYGRFPKDMKRVYDIIESKNFEASENKRALKKAFRALSKDLTYMLHSFGSRWKITVNEADEIRKLKRHVDDLYTRGFMLTGNKQLSDKRRVGERIEGFLKQGNKVLEILNKSIYKNTSNDSVTEWMV